jgi:trehalose 6-phosphate phosphatase
LIYAFSREGVACLDAVLSTKPLLAFDIDGTLAPIVDRPEDARLPDDVQRCLAALAQNNDIAIVTGRAVSDARRMFTFEPRYLIGNHGAEGVPAWHERTAAFARTVRRWRHALEACSALAASGVVIEDKRYSLSLHYRRAPDKDAARRAIAACIGTLVPTARIIDGKAVANVLPPDAPDKGAALRALIDEARYPSVLYVGDDDTDEAVFGLHLPSVLTVRVEAAPGSGATLFLRDQGEVLMLLRRIGRQ